MSDLKNDEAQARFTEATESALLLPSNFRPELKGDIVEISLAGYEALFGYIGTLQEAMNTATRNHRQLSATSQRLQGRVVNLEGLLREHGIEVPR